MNQINKMWLACSKDNYYWSYPGHKIKNAFKCALKELTIKCIFTGLVGFAHWVVCYKIHMIQIMWRFLCTGIFILWGFLIQFFLLQKLAIISKTYRAKVSTADSPYVVGGKITLVAVVQKSWFWFWTVSGTSQRTEVNW